MLEQFFRDAHAVDRHRAGLFGPYIDGLVAELATSGYTWHTVRLGVWAVSRFGRWLSDQGLSIGAASEEAIAEFRGTQRKPSWGQHGGDAVLRRLLGRLRSREVIPKAAETTARSAAERVVDDFGRFLREERSLSEATVLNYCPVVRVFTSELFGSNSVNLTKLSAADIHAFVSRHAGAYSTKRVQLMLTVLRSFLRFLFLRGYILSRLDEHVPAAPAWRKTEPPKWISADEIERVLASCNQHSAIGQRDYAILLLLARLGLRVGEVLSLELDDVRWETAEISVCGKGRQRKRFPLPEDVGRAIATYLKSSRPSCDSRRVFLRAKAPYRGLGHASSLDTIVSNALARAGLDPPLKGAHLFRHSLATRMLRKGATLPEIGQILHHASPDTTSIYAKVDIGGLRELALPWPGDCA